MYLDYKDRIKELREERQLTYTALAHAFNKSEAAIRAWETGRTKPDADTLIKLSEYFNVSTDYLLGITDFRNQEEVKSHVATSNSFADKIPKTSTGTEFLNNMLQLIELSENIAPYLKSIKGDTELIFRLFNSILVDIVEALKEAYNYTKQDKPHDFINIGALSDRKRMDTIESVYRIYRNIVTLTACIALDEGADLQQTLDFAYTLIRRTGLGSDWKLFGEYDRIYDSAVNKQNKYDPFTSNNPDN